MKNKPLCVLVDDVELNLSALKNEIEEIGLLEIEKVFADPDKFLAKISELKSEIIFLDMAMHINGIEVAGKLKGKKIIFVSGHKEEAYKAYEVDAVDFVPKPIMTSRLKQAIEKVLDRIAIEAPKPKTHVKLSSNNGKEHIEVACIELISSQDLDKKNEGQGESKIIYRNGQVPLLINSLTFPDCFNFLPKDKFIQLSRFDIVNVNNITQLIKHDEIRIKYTSRNLKVLFTSRTLSKEGKQRYDELCG